MVCKNKLAIDSWVPPFRFHVEDIGFPSVRTGFFSKALTCSQDYQHTRNGASVLRDHTSKEPMTRLAACRIPSNCPWASTLANFTLDSWVSRNSRVDLYNLRELQVEQNFISKISDIQKITQFGKKLLNPKISATKISGTKQQTKRSPCSSCLWT